MPMRTSTTRSPRNTLVLGSEALASKVYQEMLKRGGPERIRLVKGHDIRTKPGEEISHIVIADNALGNNAELTNALIDYKFRGVKIETALDSVETLNRKIWLEGLSSAWRI